MYFSLPSWYLIRHYIHTFICEHGTLWLLRSFLERAIHMAFLTHCWPVRQKTRSLPSVIIIRRGSLPTSPDVWEQGIDQEHWFGDVLILAGMRPVSSAAVWLNSSVKFKIWLSTVPLGVSASSWDEEAEILEVARQIYLVAERILWKARLAISPIVSPHAPKRSQIIDCHPISTLCGWMSLLYKEYICLYCRMEGHFVSRVQETAARTIISWQPPATTFWGLMPCSRLSHTLYRVLLANRLTNRLILFSFFFLIF